VIKVVSWSAPLSLRGWKLLLLLCLANFVAYVTVFEIPPIIGDLVHNFRITYTQAGLLMTVYAAVRALGSLLAGAFSDRYGAKHLILVGLILVSLAGFLCSVTHNYSALLALRILVGIGATAIFIPALSISMFQLTPQKVNLATGTFFSSMNLGLAVALFATPIWAASFGWRMPLKSYAITGVCVAILFFICTLRRSISSKGTPSEYAQPQVTAALGAYSVRNFPLIVICGTYFLMLFDAYGMITWLPEYLRAARQYSPTEVGSVSMLLGLVMIPGAIVAGWLGDFTGAWLVGVIGALLCALSPAALILFPHLSLSGVFLNVFAFALGTSFLVVPLTSILTHLVPASDSGKAVGLVHTVGYVGSLVSTYLSGYLLTTFGTYTSSFAVFSLSMVATLILLALVRKSYGQARLNELRPSSMAAAVEQL
jgi:MFS transporter, ACS family, hexuronate transporter